MEQRYRISAAGADHRRAGRVWGPEAAIVVAGDLTPVQWEMLRADPCITVEPCDGAEAAAGGTLEERLAAMPLPELRGRLILRACAELDPDQDLTSSGSPLTAALERLTGLATVSAAERDRAWLDHVEARGAAAAAAPAGGAA